MSSRMIIGFVGAALVAGFAFGSYGTAIAKPDISAATAANATAQSGCPHNGAGSTEAGGGCKHNGAGSAKGADGCKHDGAGSAEAGGGCKH